MSSTCTWANRRRSSPSSVTGPKPSTVNAAQRRTTACHSSQRNSGDGQVRYYHDDGDTIVEAQSILFQGAEVLTIKLEGLYGLTAADFIL